MGAAAIAATLGFHRIGDKSLWGDEGLTAALAGMSPPDIVVASWSTAAPGAMILYYEAMHFWTALFGSGEIALRAVSVIATIAAIPVVYALGVRLIGQRGALVAAAFTAVSPYVVSYSQEARPYTLVLLLSASLSLALLRAMERPSRLRWATYVCLGIVTMYVHNTMAFVVAAHFLWVVASPHRVPAVAAMICIAVASLPLAGLFGTGTPPWMAPMSWGWFHTVLTQLAGSPDLLAIFVMALAIAAIGILRTRSPGLTLALALALLPVAAEAAVSFVRPMILDRYVMVAFPGVALVVGYAISALSVAPRWAAIAFVAVLSVTGLRAWYDASPKEDWRGAVAVIGRSAQPGDQLVISPEHFRVTFDYYAVRDDRVMKHVRVGHPTPAWGMYFPPPSPWAGGPSGAIDAPRVWLVTTGDAPAGTERYELAGVVVQLMTRAEL